MIISNRPGFEPSIIKISTNDISPELSAGLPLNMYRYTFGNIPRGQKGWSDGAMVLGKLPVPGRPTIRIIVGLGPIALAIGAGGCLALPPSKL